MRVYDSEIKHRGDGWSLEIREYHDETPEPTVVQGPRRWHARIVILDDRSHQVLNFNRETQQDLYRVLESFQGLFETASTAVLDAATVN